MRDRTKGPNRSVVIRIAGNARQDHATIARRAIAAFRRRPRVQVILHLAGWQEIATSELEFLETIHQEVKAQGGTFRLGGFQDNLWAQCDWNLPSSHTSERYRGLLLANLLRQQELPLKRSA